MRCSRLFVMATIISVASLVDAAPIAGDVDLSGAVNAVDVQVVINGALGLDVAFDSDVDYSATTNAVDVQLVINAALGLSIDLDLDGLCDGAETNLGTLPAVPDTDGDTVVDGQELLIGADPIVPQANYTPGTAATVASDTLGAAGGTLTGAPGTPLEGVQVSFPAGALTEDTEVTLGYDTGSVFLTEGQAGAAAIVLAAPDVENFEEPVEITFTYSAAKNGDTIPVPYYTDEFGRLNLLDLTAFDPGNQTATFETWHPTDDSVDARKAYTQRSVYLWALALVRQGLEGTITTRFAPNKDGFQVGNPGSNINVGGECFGMTSFSLWYHINYSRVDGFLNPRFMDTVGSSNLVGQSVIATRAHTSIHTNPANYYTRLIAVQNTLNDIQRLAIIRNAMRNAQTPVVVFLTKKDDYDYGHSVLVYDYLGELDDWATLGIYDPNKPGQRRKLAFMGDGIEVFSAYGNYDKMIYCGNGSLRVREPYQRILEDAEEGFHSDTDAVISVQSHLNEEFVETGELTLTGLVESGQVVVSELEVRANETWRQAALQPDGHFSVQIPIEGGANFLYFRTFGLVTSVAQRIKRIEVYNDMRTELFVLFGEEEVSIAGRIFDAGAQVYTPLAGATVWVRRDFVTGDVYDTTTTDAQGEYSFTGLPEGEYTVWATAPGYGANLVKATAGQSSALNTYFGLDRAFAPGELAGTWNFDIYLGVSGSTVFFDMETGGGGRVNNWSDRPLDWSLGANGEFNMTWWQDAAKTVVGKLFRGAVTRDPGTPGDQPISEGDTVYIWGYMLDEQASQPTPKTFLAKPMTTR